VRPTSIKKGDKVYVFFLNSNLDEDGIVDYIPHTTGDWRLHKEDGTVIVIHNFAKMVKV